MTCLTPDGRHDFQPVAFIEELDGFDLYATLCFVCGKEGTEVE